MYVTKALSAKRIPGIYCMCKNKIIFQLLVTVKSMKSGNIILFKCVVLTSHSYNNIADKMSRPIQ